MFPLTRILSLTAAGALVALTAASIPPKTWDNPKFRDASFATMGGFHG
jgi:hypothetical protein